MSNHIHEILKDKDGLSTISFENIELPEIKVEPDKEEAEEVVSVELEEEEFTRGIKAGSYYAGFLASLMTVGVPCELAVDVLINRETIEHNLKMSNSDKRESIIEEEIQNR